MKISDPNALPVIAAARSLLVTLGRVTIIDPDDVLKEAEDELRAALDAYDYEVEEFAAREALD